MPCGFETSQGSQEGVKAHPSQHLTFFAYPLGCIAGSRWAKVFHLKVLERFCGKTRKFDLPAVYAVPSSALSQAAYGFKGFFPVKFYRAPNMVFFSDVFINPIRSLLNEEESSCKTQAFLFFKEFFHLLKVVGRQNEVGVEFSEEITGFEVFFSFVEGLNYLGARLVLCTALVLNELDKGVLGSKFLGYALRLIRAVVVDDDELVWLPTLLDKRAQAGPQVFCFVMSRKNHCNSHARSA